MIILTARDDDSILAGKIVLCHYPHDDHTFHGSVSRKGTLNSGAEVFLVRPYFKEESLRNGYWDMYKCTVLDYKTSAMYAFRDELVKKGVKCYWVDEGTTLSEYIWKEFYPNDPVPEIITLTKDYMQWNHIDSKTLGLHYGLATLGNPFSKQSTNLYCRMLKGNYELLEHFIQIGTKINVHVEKYENILAKELVTYGKLDGLIALVANATNINSLLFTRNLKDLSSIDVCVAYHINLFDNSIRHSVYRVNPDIDVGALCTKYGGGGNKGAGGFVSQQLEITDIEKREVPVDIYENLLELSSDNIVTEVFMNNTYGLKTWDLKVGTYIGRPAILTNHVHPINVIGFNKMIYLEDPLLVMFAHRADGKVRVLTYSPDIATGCSYGTRVGAFGVEMISDEVLKSRMEK